MPIKGADVLIYVNTGTAETPIWTKVAGQRDASVDRTGSAIDMNSKDNSGWEMAEPGRNSWSISCDALYSPTDEGVEALKAAWANREKVKVQVQETGTATEEGEAIVTSFNTSHPDGDNSTLSVTLQEGCIFGADPPDISHIKLA